jgi:hypothetical protein
MTSPFVMVGFGHMVKESAIRAVLVPGSKPVHDRLQLAKKSGVVWDATAGRRTRAILVLDTGQIVLSALAPDTIAGRASGETGKGE